jgi:hypothetical protein
LIVILGFLYAKASFFLSILDYTMTKLRFAEIKCQWGHTNLIPVYHVFYIYDPIGCEKCEKVIAETEQKIQKNWEFAGDIG